MKHAGPLRKGARPSLGRCNAGAVYTASTLAGETEGGPGPRPGRPLVPPGKNTSESQLLDRPPVGRLCDGDQTYQLDGQG